MRDQNQKQQQFAIRWSSTSSSSSTPADQTSAASEGAQPGQLRRWLMLLPAFAAHVCLGAPYGWSAVSGALSRHLGVVVPAADDWALDLCSYPMSIMARDSLMQPQT